MESNSAGEVLIENAEAALREAGRPFRLNQVHHSGDKIARIQAAEGKIKALSLPANFSRQWPEFSNQVFWFPGASHDDGIDALEMVVTSLQGHSADEILAALRLNAAAVDPRSEGAMLLTDPF